MKKNRTRRANRSSTSTSTSTSRMCNDRRAHAKKSRIRRQLGGRTANVMSPLIKYNKGDAPSAKLACTKCGGAKFLVKTITLGTKVKSFFAAEIFNNRFKIFQCTGCGFVQLYSNSITCDGKSCDPVF